jgi:hypothetical protein
MQSHTELRHGWDHSMGIPNFCVCEVNMSRYVETISFATLLDLLCDNTLDGGGFKTTCCFEFAPILQEVLNHIQEIHLHLKFSICDICVYRNVYQCHQPIVMTFFILHFKIREFTW